MDRCVYSFVQCNMKHRGVAHSEIWLKMNEGAVGPGKSQTRYPLKLALITNPDSSSSHYNEKAMEDSR